MSSALKTAVRTLLAGNATLTGLVGDKIRPDELHQKDSLPAILFELPEDEAVSSLEDTTDTGTATLIVLCAAHSSATADSIAAAAKSVLDGYRGTVGAVEFAPVTYLKTDREHAAADDDSDENDCWFVELHFAIWYRE